MSLCATHSFAYQNKTKNTPIQIESDWMKQKRNGRQCNSFKQFYVNFNSTEFIENGKVKDLEFPGPEVDVFYLRAIIH